MLQKKHKKLTNDCQCFSLSAEQIPFNCAMLNGKSEYIFGPYILQALSFCQYYPCCLENTLFGSFKQSSVFISLELKYVEGLL